MGRTGVIIGLIVTVVLGIITWRRLKEVLLSECRMRWSELSALWVSLLGSIWAAHGVRVVGVVVTWEIGITTTRRLRLVRRV